MDMNSVTMDMASTSTASAAMSTASSGMSGMSGMGGMDMDMGQSSCQISVSSYNNHEKNPGRERDEIANNLSDAVELEYHRRMYAPVLRFPVRCTSDSSVYGLTLTSLIDQAS